MLQKHIMTFQLPVGLTSLPLNQSLPNGPAALQHFCLNQNRYFQRGIPHPILGLGAYTELIREFPQISAITFFFWSNHTQNMTVALSEDTGASRCACGCGPTRSTTRDHAFDFLRVRPPCAKPRKTWHFQRNKIRQPGGATLMFLMCWWLFSWVRHVDPN